MESEMKGRTALVIGGCRGIGRTITLRLARDGFLVTATCRHEGADSEATKSAAALEGNSVRVINYDVTSQMGLEPKAFPALPDVIVYNAGIVRDNLFALMKAEEWRDVIQTNLDGFFFSVKPFVAPMMARGSGRIIVTSSASGQTGQSGQVNYSASKAALLGAVKALAREVGRKGILVNAIAPGVIDTEMAKRFPVDKTTEIIPLHRYGRPEEVAGVVSFLAGPDSTYVHGQVLGVNGGLVM